MSRLSKNTTITIGTPMYGSTCRGEYVHSLISLFSRIDVPVNLIFELHNNDIPTARNKIATQFMESGASHLLFVDNDISFDPEGTIRFLEEGISKDIVAGACPKRILNFRMLRAAIDSGIPNEDLEYYLPSYAFNFLPGTNSVSSNNLFEIQEAGTGLILISRKVFEEFDERGVEEYTYVDTHIKRYFHTGVDENNRYVSSDYVFCQEARKLGIKVWLCPWIEIGHNYNHTFRGMFSLTSNIKESSV